MSTPRQAANQIITNLEHWSDTPYNKTELVEAMIVEAINTACFEKDQKIAELENWNIEHGGNHEEM